MFKEKKETKQKKFSIYKLCGKIGDILFIPIIILSLFSSTSMLIQKRQNKPTQLLGYSLVNILSPSMTNAGLKKGDTVITVKTTVHNIKLGDVIAFYEMRNDPSDKKPKILVEKYLEPQTIKTLYPTNEIKKSEENVTIDTYEKVERENSLTVEYAQKIKKRIIFHMVIGIYVDEDGYVFYETKGTNSGKDNGYIRSDFVIGEYVETPVFLRRAMTYCASPTGMIILVCVPLSILVLLQCLSLTKQIEIMSYEKQLLNRKKKFTDKDIRESFNGNDMELYNKVYYYYITDISERNAVLDFMWSNILNKENPNKKEWELINIIQESSKLLDTSDLKYWEYWIDNTKGYNKKRIKNYYEEIAVLNILNSTNKKAQNIQQSKVETDSENQKNTLDKEIEKTIDMVTNSNNLQEKSQDDLIINSQQKQKGIIEQKSAPEKIKTPKKVQSKSNTVANKQGVKTPQKIKQNSDQN